MAYGMSSRQMQQMSSSRCWTSVFVTQSTQVSTAAVRMGLLSPCLQAEARRNRRFRGVTLVFEVRGNGRAGRVRTKKRSSARLLRCLRGALGQIPFQRHGGSPRQISYPMFIQR